MFRKLDVFPSSDEGRQAHTMLGLLERANLKHWIQQTGCLLPLVRRWKPIHFPKRLISIPLGSILLLMYEYKYICICLIDLCYIFVVISSFLECRTMDKVQKRSDLSIIHHHQILSDSIYYASIFT
jgi:hypothetical protein